MLYKWENKMRLCTRCVSSVRLFHVFSCLLWSEDFQVVSDNNNYYVPNVKTHQKCPIASELRIQIGGGGVMAVRRHTLLYARITHDLFKYFFCRYLASLGPSLLMRYFKCSNGTHKISVFFVSVSFSRYFFSFLYRAILILSNPHASTLYASISEFIFIRKFGC